MNEKGLLIAAGVIAIAVAAVWLNERRIRRARRTGTALQGFGGWLLLLAIVQWLILASWISALAFMVLDGMTWLQRDDSSIGLAQSPLVAAGAVLALCVNVMMTLKRRAFPRLLRLQIVADTVLWVVLAAMEVVLSQPPKPPVPWMEELANLVVPTISATLWFLYSLRSVRVRNTFVR